MSPDPPKRSKTGWHIANQQSAANGLTITTYANGRRRYDAVSSANPFIDIAFNRFDLAQVCDILLHENPSFKGHKDALAAAFCAWMLGHEERWLRRRSVGLSIGRTLARAEQKAVKKSADMRVEANQNLRTTRLPPAFFEELYYPIGGLDYITQSPARYGLSYEMKHRRDRLYHAVTFAAIDHCYHRLISANPVLDDVSIERSCELVVLIQLTANDFKAPDVNNLKTHYLAGIRRSLPFLYAASSIRHSETETLLDAIANANWSSILRPGVLRELFGKTLFYAQDIYAKQQKAKLRRLHVDEIAGALHGVEPQQFDPPDRVNAHVKLIEYYYSKEGYDACHTANKAPFWFHPPFWSAIDLPVPRNEKRPRGSKRNT